MADRLERLVNLTATLLDDAPPAHASTSSPSASSRGYPDDLDRAPAPVRARQGDPARARRPDHGRDRSTLRRRAGATASTPTTTTCPTSGSTDDELAALHVAVTAVRLEGDDRPRRRCAKLGGARRARAPTAPLAELEVTPRLADLFDAVSRHAVGHVRLPGRDPPARAVRRRAPVRPLVRGRPRPRPRRAPGLPGRPHRRRRRARAADGVRRRPPASIPADYLARRPADLRRRPARRRPRARRRAARGAGRRRSSATRRWSSADADGAVVVALAGRQPRRVPQLGARPARPRRGARRRPSCAPTWSTWLDARVTAGSDAVSPRPLAGPRSAARARARPVVLAHPGVTIAELADALRGRPSASSSATSSCSRCAGCRRTPPTGSSTSSMIDGGGRDPPRRLLRAPAAPHPGRRPRAARRRPRAARGAGLRPRRARSRPRSTSSSDALGAPGGSRSTSARADAPRARCRTRPRPTSSVEIDYYSFARDEMTTRVIDPVARVLRVRRVVPRRVVPPRRRRAPVPRRPRPRRPRRPASTSTPPTARRRRRSRDLVYHPAPDDPRVTLRLAPAAEWVVESHPARVGRRAAGTARGEVVLAVSEPAWLERLLLGLGPDADGGRARRSSSTLGAGRGGPSARPLRTSPERGRAPRADPRSRICEDGRSGASSVTDDVDAPTVVEPPARRRRSAAAPAPATAPATRGHRRTRRRPPRRPTEAEHRTAPFVEWGDPHRRRARHRARHQDVPVPGVLHPVGVDGADARGRRPRPRQQAQLRPPRPAPRRHRRVRGRAQREWHRRRHRRPREARRSGCRARRSPQCETDRVYIDGRLLDESYLPEGHGHHDPRRCRTSRRTARGRVRRRQPDGRVQGARRARTS